MPCPTHRSPQAVASPPPRPPPPEAPAARRPASQPDLAGRARSAGAAGSAPRAGPVLSPDEGAERDLCRHRGLATGAAPAGWSRASTRWERIALACDPGAGRERPVWRNLRRPLPDGLFGDIDLFRHRWRRPPPRRRSIMTKPANVVATPEGAMTPDGGAGSLPNRARPAAAGAPRHRGPRRATVPLAERIAVCVGDAPRRVVLMRGAPPPLDPGPVRPTPPEDSTAPPMPRCPDRTSRPIPAPRQTAPEGNHRAEGATAPEAPQADGRTDAVTPPENR